jgi:hypothetical protein
MSIPFNAGVPQSGNIISQTQNPILQNFQTLGTVFNNSATGNNFTQYLFQNVAAILTGGNLPANPMSILHNVNGGSNSIAFNGKPVLYYANSIADYPVLGNVLFQNNGIGGINYTVQLGNFVINAGYAPLSTASAYVFNYLQPFSTKIIFRNATPDDTRASSNSWNVSSGTSDLTKITINFSTGTSATGGNLYFLALGY